MTSIFGCLGGIILLFAFIFLFPFVYIWNWLFNIKRKAEKAYKEQNRPYEKKQKKSTKSKTGNQKIYGPNEGEYIDFVEIDEHEEHR